MHQDAGTPERGGTALDGLVFHDQTHRVAVASQVTVHPAGNRPVDLPKAIAPESGSGPALGW